MDKKEFLEMVQVDEYWSEWHNDEHDISKCPVCGAELEYDNLLRNNNRIGLQFICNHCRITFDVWFKYDYHCGFEDVDAEYDLDWSLGNHADLYGEM